jgi:hypothetical protein
MVRRVPKVLEVLGPLGFSRVSRGLPLENREHMDHPEHLEQPANLENPLQPRACMRSRRRVASRASSEQISTIETSTSAPAHAWRCQSSYGPVA